MSFKTHSWIYILIFILFVLLVVNIFDKEDTFFAISSNKIVNNNEIRVVDGDTLEFNREKYRLYGIDCPESNQKYGSESTKITKDILKKHDHISLRKNGMDQYGRNIAVVSLGQQWTLQEELLSLGSAWLYTDFCKIPECEDWKLLEMDARRKKMGLWAQSNPIAPWKWRKLKRR